MDLGPEAGEGVEGFIDHRPDIAPPATVAAGWAAPLDALLTAEGHAAVAAIPSLDEDAGGVEAPEWVGGVDGSGYPVQRQTAE